MFRFLFLISCYFIFNNSLLAANNKIDKISDYPDLTTAKYVFLIDYDSKEIILEKNADVKISPSSMTKMMTAYIVFDHLKQGKITLNNKCLIGKEAWSKGGSTMFLNYGDIVTINKLLTGLLVVSGNDAAIALAEIISGNDKDFAQLMNKTAKKIGLKNSNFKNPHGLNEEGHYMTLRDLATLSIKIINDFPEYMHYFSTPKFTYKNITQNNRNPLLAKKYKGIMGMKTGYTSKGGYGITAIANRNGRKLIAITNGTKTAKKREKIITQTLNYGFNNYKKVTIFNKGSIIANSKVWFGDNDLLQLVSKNDVTVTLPKNKTINDLKVKIKYKQDIIYAPISKEKEMAILTIEFAGKKIKELSLFAKENIDKASFFDRIWGIIKYKFYTFIDEFL